MSRTATVGCKKKTSVVLPPQSPCRSPFHNMSSQRFMRVVVWHVFHSITPTMVHFGCFPPIPIHLKWSRYPPIPPSHRRALLSLLARCQVYSTERSSADGLPQDILILPMRGLCRAMQILPSNRRRAERLPTTVKGTPQTPERP